MEDLMGLILTALSMLIPKPIQEWMMKQKKAIRIILQIFFYSLASWIAVLIAFLAFCVVMLIFNALFDAGFSLKDFGPSWIF